MRWPHYEHVFFDCDSTLTAVEGIDVLAESVGKGQRVRILTDAAMDGQLDLSEVYDKRLRAVRPTQQQVLDIRRSYKRHIVEDAARVVTALQGLGHKVYIISGGLAEPVIEFGIYLGIPRERIRAVGLTYNELSGRWWEKGDERRYLAHQEGALTVSDGKAQIVRELLGEQRGRSLLIGDGYSDLLAGAAVDLFVGYGGVVARPKVQAAAPAYITCPSLAPLLPLAGGPVALRLLRSWPMHYQTLSTKALYLIHTGVVTFTDEHLESRFRAAFLNPEPTTH
ncbi:MAG TPA: haloacid dehalogenase-like hydrolase [Promineifilum sp.]|nr:haloacid dehalogenase-like hydrolase [Promineifilum sp.]HQF71928.1 haloacid dehalogenase-like hydrolase [Promineifilum sp.]